MSDGLRGEAELVTGLAPVILQHYDLREGDVMIIPQPWGINPVTIDTASEAKRLGLTLIAITSPEFSKAVPPRHPHRRPSNKNLFEIADIVIDIHMPFTDSVVDIPGFGQKVSPVSTIVNAFALNCLVALTVEKLVKKGVTPPVWVSANIPGGDEHNKKYLERYRNKIKHLW